VLSATITTTASVRISGMGESTFIDGTALAGGVIAITISAVDYVELDHFSINTKGAGGGPCVFIEDGADEFNIHNIKFIDSDAEVILIGGTSIIGGTITNNVFLTGDSALIYADMDAVNSWFRGVITENIMLDATLSGIQVINGEHGVIANNTISSARTGIYIEQSTHMSLTDNVISDTSESGIKVQTATSFILIDGNLLDTNGETGILVNATNCTAQNNIVKDCTLDAIKIFDSDCIIQDNIIVNATLQGIELTVAAHHCVVSGNNISLCGLEAIYCDAPDCIISDNICYDDGQTGAGTYHEIQLLDDADRCIVSNNHISSPGDSSEDCIHLDDGATQVSITGNYCYNGMGSGIALTANNDNCIITGNILHSNDDYGVEITAATCNDNRVLNNEYITNVTGAFSDGGTGTITPFINVLAPNPDAFIGTHAAQQMLDTVDTIIRFEVPFPREFQELVTAEALLVSAAAGNLRRVVATNWGQFGSLEAYNVGSDAIAVGQVAVLADDMTALDLAAAFTGVVGEDWVGVELTREASDALDTIDDIVYFVGFRLRYV